MFYCKLKDANTGNFQIYFTGFLFCLGPILVWDASPWGLVVSTLTDDELCSSECERHKFAGASASIFFYHEKHSCVDMSYFFDYFLNLQIWFQIFFNWWHSPLTWWHSQELKFKKSFEINNQFCLFTCEYGFPWSAHFSSSTSFFHGRHEIQPIIIILS